VARETADPPSQRPPYWVWREGTEIEAGVGWVRHLVDRAHGAVAEGCAALAEADTALAYVEGAAPGRIPAGQARRLRDARARAESEREALAALFHALDALATLV